MSGEINNLEGGYLYGDRMQMDSGIVIALIGPVCR
jgi:hypothetical protein